jgi:hypothetical protein
MIIGAVLGAVLGSASAWTYVQAKETGGLWTTTRREGRQVAVRAAFPDYFKLGMTVFALIRQVMGLVSVRQA